MAQNLLEFIEEFQRKHGKPDYIAIAEAWMKADAVWDALPWKQIPGTGDLNAADL